MGKYDLSAQLVHRYTTRLLEARRLPAPPPWYNVVAEYPPSGRSIVRPCIRPGRGPTAGNKPRKGNRPSRDLFRPLPIEYEEDALRDTFFKEHPWELARPRIIVEDGGHDTKWWDWSRGINQRTGGRGVDGESVIQRQRYLMREKKLNRAHAYDIARREFYAYRHQQEISQRTAREEALHVGAYFGASVQDVGAKLEDETYRNWKETALRRGRELQQKQTAGSMLNSAQAVAGGEASEQLEDGLGDPTSMNEPTTSSDAPPEGVRPSQGETANIPAAR